MLSKTSIIIDSDIGSDDYMAIAYLLSQPDTITVEAITVVHGLTDVHLGASNTRKLLFLIREAHAHHIPIYIGENNPIGDSRPFPDEWKHTSHTIFNSYHDRQSNPGSSDLSNSKNEYVKLLASIKDHKEKENNEFGDDAVEFLARRLSETDRPARIVALGPLTNIALALRKITPSPLPDVCTTSSSSTSSSMHEIVIMGGAVEVKGNLYYESVQDFNSEAEWNIFCDPLAASEVFSRQDIRKIMIGLDATNDVPVTQQFLHDLKIHQEMKTLTESGSFINHILLENLKYIHLGEYYAWDPLVAVYMTHSAVVNLRPAELFVHTQVSVGSVGRTQLISWMDEKNICASSTESSSPSISCCGHHLYVGVSANRQLFEEAFLSAFTLRNDTMTIINSIDVSVSATNTTSTTATDKSNKIYAGLILALLLLLMLSQVFSWFLRRKKMTKSRSTK